MRKFSNFESVGNCDTKTLLWIWKFTSNNLFADPTTANSSKLTNYDDTLRIEYTIEVDWLFQHMMLTLKHCMHETQCPRVKFIFSKELISNINTCVNSKLHTNPKMEMFCEHLCSILIWWCFFSFSCFVGPFNELIFVLSIMMRKFSSEKTFV